MVTLAQEKCTGKSGETPSLGETDPTMMADGIFEDRECEELNKQAQTLYDGIDCSLARSIIRNNDIMAGIGTPADGSDPSTVRDAVCIGESTCVDEAVEVVKGLIDEGGAVAGEGVGKFI